MFKRRASELHDISAAVRFFGNFLRPGQLNAIGTLSNRFVGVVVASPVRASEDQLLVFNCFISENWAFRQTFADGQLLKVHCSTSDEVDQYWCSCDNGVVEWVNRYNRQTGFVPMEVHELLDIMAILKWSQFFCE